MEEQDNRDDRDKSPIYSMYNRSHFDCSQFDKAAEDGKGEKTSTR